MSADHALFTRALLAAMPKRGLTEAMYWLARRRLPEATMAAVLRAYVRFYEVNLDEVDGALADFPTLDAFFTRALKPGVRPIDEAPDAVLCPSDGVLAALGPIEDLQLTQIKGKRYSLPELLDSDTEAARYAEGSFATIYLSPRDYHRVHAPMAGSLRALRHVPGTLFPVNARATRHVPRLLARNERLVFHLETPQGPAALVMVAATCVSTITVSLEGAGAPFTRKEREDRVLDPAPAFATAAELGAFHMGSTVVLVLPKDAVSYVPRREGTPVQMGERLATWL